jgi:hypothetical protein
MKCTVFHVLQVWLGFGLGWEELVEGSNRKEILQQLQEYQNDSPEYDYRIIQRKADWVDYS